MRIPDLKKTYFVTELSLCVYVCVYAYGGDALAHVCACKEQRLTLVAFLNSFCTAGFEEESHIEPG